jgi:uncharacterized protein YmfQ (DUF2313 family)
MHILLTDFDRGWLVAILEGEGSFTIQRARYPKPIVQISMTDQDVICRVARLLGTETVYTQNPPARPGCKTQYLTRIQGERAVNLMRELHPHMGSRRQEQIDRVLEECDPTGDRYQTRNQRISATLKQRKGNHVDF